MTRHDASRGGRIVAFIATSPTPPTVREIMSAVGLRSPSTVAYYLERLRRQGIVTWQDKHARTLRLGETDESVHIGHLTEPQRRSVRELVAYLSKLG